MNGLELREKRKKLKLSQVELAQKLGISSRTLMKYENGEDIPVSKSEFFRRIVTQIENEVDGNEINAGENLHVNEPEELLANKNGNVFEQGEDGRYRIYVKKVPVKALGSYPSHFQDADFYEDLQQISFPVDHLGRGKYICFEVQGDSMNGGRIDDTKEGAELLCRELGRHHWKDGFKPSPYGWVIIHKSTVLFKDIKNLNLENGDMILGSRSGLPQHQDFTINMNDVRQIWKVIKRTQ